MGAQTFPVLSTEENKRLKKHLEKHKIYPFQWRQRLTAGVGDFPKVDGALGNYKTLIFRPDNYVGIISIAQSIILTPNNTIGEYAVVMSYNDTLTLAGQSDDTEPASTGQEVYALKTNGGAINDFQVFYPLNWYLEKGRPFYIHIWMDRATFNAGVAKLATNTIIGTLITTQQ